MKEFTNTQDYEIWVEENEENIAALAAESGADREMDFDAEEFDLECYKRHFENYYKEVD